MNKGFILKMIVIIEIWQLRRNNFQVQSVLLSFTLKTEYHADEDIKAVTLLLSEHAEKAQDRGQEQTGKAKRHKDEPPWHCTLPQKQTSRFQKQLLAVWEMLRHQTIKDGQQRQEAAHAAAWAPLPNPSELC